MCVFVCTNPSTFLADDYNSQNGCARICVTTYCSLIRTTITGQPIIDRLIILQSPCNKAQLDPLLDTRLRHVVIYVRTELPPVFNYPQLWMAASIPRNLLPHHNQPHQNQQQRQQSRQQQRQQQHQSSSSICSSIRSSIRSSRGLELCHSWSLHHDMKM